MRSCFSNDGNWLASGDADARILLWRTADRTLAQTLRGHAGELNALAFAPDDNLLASAGEDGKVLLWNAADGRQVAALQGNPTRRCAAWPSTATARCLRAAPTEARSMSGARPRARCCSSTSFRAVQSMPCSSTLETANRIAGRQRGRAGARRDGRRQRRHLTDRFRLPQQPHLRKRALCPSTLDGRTCPCSQRIPRRDFDGPPPVRPCCCYSAGAGVVVHPWRIGAPATRRRGLAVRS